MNRLLIFLMFFSLQLRAVDISEYEPSGEIQNLSGFGDLSGGDWVELLDGTIGSAWVDNKNGRTELPNGVCTLKGDREAIVQARIGYVWIVNEARDGMLEYNMDNCLSGRKIMFGLFSGGDGIEGVEVETDGVTFYILAENTATIYSFVDDGFTERVNPIAVAVIPNCMNAGDLAIRDNSMVIACESRPNLVEYSLGDWQFISSNDKIIFTNTEVVYFTNNGMYAGGEPDQLQYYTIQVDPVDPPVETEEVCTYNGTVTVNIETGSFDSQTVPFVCPTVIVSGTLN